MKLNTLIVFCSLLALFLLAGCPRDTESADGSEVVPRPPSGSQDAGDTAAGAAGMLGSEEEEADAAAGDAENAHGEGAAEEGSDEAGLETAADEAVEATDDSADEEGADMADKQGAGGATTVVLETTKGDIVIEVHNDWAPLGAAHFLELVEDGYYDNTPFFRVLNGFVAQFGISANPQMQAKWGENTLTDDPVVQGNKPGYVAFATAGPNTRTTQIFINYGDNSGLDNQGFACFARVVEGMDVAQELYKCEWPDQQGLRTPEGLERFKQAHPQADFIKRAYIRN